MYFFFIINKKKHKTKLCFFNHFAINLCLLIINSVVFITSLLQNGCFIHSMLKIGGISALQRYFKLCIDKILLFVNN